LGIKGEIRINNKSKKLFMKKLIRRGEVIKKCYKYYAI